MGIVTIDIPSKSKLDRLNILIEVFCITWKRRDPRFRRVSETLRPREKELLSYYLYYGGAGADQLVKIDDIMGLSPNSRSQLNTALRKRGLIYADPLTNQNKVHKVLLNIQNNISEKDEEFFLLKFTV